MDRRVERPTRSLFAVTIDRVLPRPPRIAETRAVDAVPAPTATRVEAVVDQRAPIQLLPPEIIQAIADLVVGDWTAYADGRSLATVASTFRAPAQRALLRFANIKPDDAPLVLFSDAVTADGMRGPFAVRHFRCWDSGEEGNRGP